VSAVADLRRLGRALTDRFRPERPDLTTTIRALHAVRADDVLASVAPYVGHSDRAVRGAAAMFLFDFDETGAVGAPAFARQLRRETDAAMLEILIDGLRRWKVRPDEALLVRLSSESSIPASLRDSVRAAQVMGGHV